MYKKEIFYCKFTNESFEKDTPKEFYAVLYEYKVNYEVRETPLKLIFNKININETDYTQL